jgi:FixJ family two-component response regulator
MRVIVCSGYDLDASVQALLEAGASSFIGKPFQVTTLAIEVRKALDN